jgi:hypothetical protein
MLMSMTSTLLFLAVKPGSTSGGGWGLIYYINQPEIPVLSPRLKSPEMWAQGG